MQARTGQQLAMTPQLQQSIRLLQLSAAEFEQELEETLSANPFLDRDDSLRDPTDVPLEAGQHLDDHASEQAGDAPGDLIDVITQPDPAAAEWFAATAVAIPPPVTASPPMITGMRRLHCIGCARCAAQ